MRADGGPAAPVRDLDDPAAFASGDPHGVRHALAAFPAQCREALALTAQPPLAQPEPPRVLVVAGMGGSAVGGDLLAAVLAETSPVPVLVHRGYGLPPTADRRGLVIASSYSGETVEVLSAVESALARGVPVVAITTGGALGRVAAAGGLPQVTLPGGLMPRLALGYLFLSAVAVARAAGLAAPPPPAAEEALDVLTGLGAALGHEQPEPANEAKRLARALAGRLPVVYGGPATAAAAYRWKTDLEENAKVFAVAGVLPEMQHNEIEAWRDPAARTMHAVLLREPHEPAAIAQRFALLRELIEPGADGVSEVWARGAGRLARLLSLVSLGQWTSYYLAILRGVDPWTVPVLDAVKRRLADGTTDGAAP